LKNKKITAKEIAFIAIMSSLANILSWFSIPIGLTSIHLTQLPIILTALSLGRWSGGFYRLIPVNPYILFGNAILGYFTGFFYSHLKKMKTRIVIPQTISVLASYLIQTPYLYLTDVYLVSIPTKIVLTIILPKLLVENIISVLLCHLVIYRVDIYQRLQ
jgi:uncharacterized membrane protein